MRLQTDRTENIESIRASARSFASSHGGVQRAREGRFNLPGYDRNILREMGEQGWIAIRLTGDEGGFGLGLHEYSALVSELGRQLAPEPLIQCVLAASFPHPLRDDVVAGRCVVMPVLSYPGGSAPAARIDGARLSAPPILVPSGMDADAFLVETDRGMALVEAGAQGVTSRPHLAQDGGSLSIVAFAEAPCVAVECDIFRPREEAILGFASYLLGAMEEAFDISIAHLKERRQFGVPIGSFQSLQHRAVDMKTEIMLAQAGIRKAAAILEDKKSSRSDIEMAVSRAKLRAARAAFLVGRETVQFHGASGISDEGAIGLYLRKIMSMYQQAGTMRAHASRYEDHLFRKLSTQ